MNHQSFSRRTFLRGVGVSMALPWMESFRVWGDEAKAVRGASEAPVRLAVLFSGNGFHARSGGRKGAAATWSWARYSPRWPTFASECSSSAGLFNAEAQKGNIHSSQTGNLLSGAPLASGGEIRSGTSFDQLLARAHGKSTKVPSLVLACEKSNPSVHKNYSMLYSSHISWTSPTTPTPLELYPALAFDRLFRDEVERGDKSVLDAVLSDARDFRRVSQPGRSAQAGRVSRLGARGRSSESSEPAIAASCKAGGPPSIKPNIPRPADGMPQDIGEHMRLMCDILVLAFQTDTTRVCTLKLNNDHSSLRFPNLGVDYMIHHLLSHSDTADWLKVNQFFLKQVAYIAAQARRIHEGDRTALDNSMIMFCSSMLNGNHDASQLPVVVLGGAGGQIKGGRVLDYLGKPNRKMCSLYLSLLDKAGLHLDEFGDSREPLAEV